MATESGNNKAMGTIPAVILSLLVLISLPVTLPVAMLQQSFIENRKRRLASTQVCSRCNMLLGLDSLQRADNEWSAYVTKLHADHPHSRFRLVRKVMAICDCGVKYSFGEKHMRFVLIPDE
jgi:hypothetical protein